VNYHCMINAFARVLDVTPDLLVNELSHNGLSTFPGTDIQRTHHIQEITDVCSKLWGYWFAPIELVPQSYDPQTGQRFKLFFGDGTVSANFDRFQSYLQTSDGVIIGMRGLIGHAVHNDRGMCFDNHGQWKLWAEGTDFVPAVYWRAICIT